MGVLLEYSMEYSRNSHGTGIYLGILVKAAVYRSSVNFDAPVVASVKL